jgi:hypothetical protein
MLTRIIALPIVLLSFAMDLAHADNDSTLMGKNPARVVFMIEIPIWFPGSRGTFTIGDNTLNGDSKLNEVFSQYFKSDTKVDYYYVGKFAVTLNKWQLQGDIFGGKLHNTITFSFEQTHLADMELATIMPRMIVGYQVFEHSFKRRPLKRRLEFWPYAGCRFYHVNIKNNSSSVLPEFEINKNWIDPLIGFRIQMTLNRFAISFENDIGGFGVGSDITYWFQISGEFKAAKFLAIKLGWIYMNINYNDSKRDESFNYKMVLQGPLAGIIFNF